MSDLAEKLFVLVQRLLPKQLLTAVVHRIASIRIVSIKNFLIQRFIALYKVNTAEVKLTIPDEFDSFNAFFIRELSANARPIDPAQDTIVSPVDGTVSAAGRIEHDKLYQAKGIDYSLIELLATDTEDAANYVDGKFATIYLAPFNYHRVHAPLAGYLESMLYIPGDLFSVNRATVAQLPGIFVRNERLVCHIQTEYGPMVLIFVGALNVGSITTQWSGKIRPRHNGVVEQISLPPSAAARRVEKGALLGWFNMGSTVIMLYPPDSTTGLDTLSSGQNVQVGEALGRMATAR